MNLDRDLNEQQREAVHFGDSPLLVLAGPGTGKTRVITYRVAHLIQSNRVPPDKILTLTFTNKAAQELGERVHRLLGESVGGEVWIGTFHNICSRLLRDAPEAFGIRPDFAVFDQETQNAILRDCLRRTGVSTDDAEVNRVRDFISAGKSSLKDPLDRELLLFDDDGNTLDDPRYLEAVRVTIQAYAERLRSHGALDFDDLLVAVTVGLRKNASLRQKIRRRFRHILVDEYQDINEAQYEFLKTLSAKPFPITAVGDEDQSIYAWRGSSPEWLRRFRKDYAPEVIELEVNYRSTRTVLHAAAELIGHNRRERQKPLVTDAEAGSPIVAYSLADEEATASHCARVIRKLVSEAHISYRDIAIFYRNHRQADLLEQKLRLAQIPIQRVLPASQALNVQESGLIAWLRFLAHDLDKDLLEAFAYPTNALDEWTRVWLQRRALRESCRFVETVRRLDAETPPLTRVTLNRVMRRLDGLRARIESKPVSEVVRAVVEELDLYRSPYASSELDATFAPERFPSLADAADVVASALERGAAPRLVATGHLDDLSAALIVRETLSEYFGTAAPLNVVDDGAVIESDAALTLAFGDVRLPDDPGSRFVHFGAPDASRSPILAPCSPDGAPRATAWTAFRFSQRLLEVAERLDDEDVVVYDLETTGNNPRKAEIVEFAATRLSKPERHEHRYIRPKAPIPRFLTRVHRIDDATVRDKPGIEEQIADIHAFFGDTILVGHNIAGFDNRLIDRDLMAHLRVPLQNPTYDTYVVAKRLYPHENLKLGALADKFGIQYKDLHRANHDVDVAKALFRILRQTELALRARSSLPEMLPLLAVGCAAREAWDTRELDAYRSAAGRWLRSHDVIRGVVDLYPAEVRAESRRLLNDIRRGAFPQSREDDEWNSLRERFLNRVQRFVETSEGATLRDFLNARSLAEPADDLDPQDDAVTLMTLHAAKGTEFRAVIVTTMEDGILPTFRAFENDALLAEERRLCYVGMTRAKERLYFVTARRRDGRDREPSRFLNEIPANLMKRWSPATE